MTPAHFVGDVMCALLATTFFPHSPKARRYTLLEMNNHRPRWCFDTSLLPLPFEIPGYAPEESCMLHRSYRFNFFVILIFRNQG